MDKYLKSIAVFLISISPLVMVFSQTAKYESRYRTKIKKEFHNYPFVFDDSHVNMLKEYLNLYPDDGEIRFKLVNLYELYGDHEKSIQLLKKMENDLANQSKTHEYFYFRNIGYQRYFYQKFNMNKELLEADKIYFNLKKPAIANYFQKESWIPIDTMLKRGECPSDSDFLLFQRRLNKYENGISEGVALMIFLRMHFDMLFDSNCMDKAKDIRESFQSYNEIRKNKYSEALYLTMLADYKLLEEGNPCSKSEAYELYDKVDGYIGREINAKWIRQEIQYRMERINGNSELERSNGDCGR